MLQTDPCTDTGALCEQSLRMLLRVIGESNALADTDMEAALCYLDRGLRQIFSGQVQGSNLRLFSLLVEHWSWMVAPLHPGRRPGHLAKHRQGDLPPRKQQTLELLMRGASEKEIAVKLGISPHTVHEHVAWLYRHFEVGNRAALLALFV